MATLLELYSQQAEEARTGNIKRQKAVESIFDEIIKRYRPGGEFGKSYLQQLGAQKTRDVGAVSQSDISRGLFGIRPYGQEWESTVGAPSRLKLEDLMMERLSTAQLGKAEFLQKIEQPYPDYNSLMQTEASRASILQPRTFTRTYGGTYGASSFPDMFSIGGGGGGTAPNTSGSLDAQNQAALAERKRRAEAAIQPSTTTVSQSQIYSDLLAGEQAAAKQTATQTNSLQQSVLAKEDKPPSWTGNYSTWKKAMDEYNKRHGLPLTGY